MNSATYDDAGRTDTRTINGDTQSFVYDGEGLLTSVSGFGAGQGAITGPTAPRQLRCRRTELPFCP
ncbi:hypothetical protein [Streptomyces sp. H51]|uniref:hypothetical protein n=1 Tax=Streptomyces sp. H51 TaxID=3111770 RepID=UPI002D79D6CB|nr:hypothetical protein [Streptomyces sp. H51]